MNSVILKPVITEKSIAAQEKGVYSFWVTPKASKNQVQVAFTSIFGVKPIAVNTIKVKGKVKTDWKKRLPIKKSDRKKAILTLPKDTKIELLKLSTK